MVDIFPLFTFVLATTFSPGPNNISSASMGISFGYKNTLGFLLGISSGFFIVMLLCALLSSFLLSTFPAAEIYLRWMGAGYIIWLAVGILKSSSAFNQADPTPKVFTKGLMLQLINPKVLVYGLTLYSTFLASISHRIDVLIILAAAFALVAFLATSTWAVCGAIIKLKLEKKIFKRCIHVALCLLLIYTAIDLSGILEMI